MAESSARRSEYARQVGAAILTQQGELFRWEEMMSQGHQVVYMAQRTG